jgi:lactate permease
MKWTQVIDPFDSIALSALVAVIPILFIFWGLIIKKMKGYKVSMLATLIAVVIAVLAYHMPVKLALLSTLNGALYGLFPICWIIIAAVFLFNITVKSGQFEVIKHFMASITPDRRLQALLIAFSFGSFLEGTAGFGAPVAITAAMLVGLGFNPLYAASICLIANTAPVAFGAIGIPITVASQVTSIPETAISQMVGRTLPILSILLPMYLVIIIAGFKKAVEVLPAILVSGLTFGLLQWSSSNFLGPALPDVIAGIGSIISLVLFLKFWKPKNIWRFEHEPAPTISQEKLYTGGQVLKAWSPFILLTIMIIAWGLGPIKELLNYAGQYQFAFPGIHNEILDKSGNPLPHIFKFNYLSATGTSILISAIIAVPLIGLSFREAGRIFIETLQQLKFAILTIASVLAFAYIVNDAGITLTIAGALASTGFLFPFFAPILGWLGVFITGSDTSANALFGKLQAATATSIGVDPVVTVSANVSGGVVGKMISPQSIAVAAAAGQLLGQESKLFRMTVKHSFIMLIFICFLVIAQAYLFSGIIPHYNMKSANTVTPQPDFNSGYLYLSVLLGVIIVLAIIIMTTGRKMKAAVTVLLVCLSTTALSQQLHQRKSGSPLDHLPNNIRQLTHFGERADFSPDNKHVAFMAKSFGDAMVYDLETGIIRCLTCNVPGAAFLRVMHLSNGDYILIGPEKFNDIRSSREHDNELWYLNKEKGSKPVKFGLKFNEGVAISKTEMKICYAQTSAQVNDLPPHASRLVVADVQIENGRPKLINQKKVYESPDANCILEAADFYDHDTKMTFTCYEPNDNASVMGIGLKTGTVTNFSKNPHTYNECEGIIPGNTYTLVEADRQCDWLGGKRGSGNIDIWKLKLDGTGKDFERITNFNDYDGCKASNPVVSTDGKYMAFQFANTKDPAGVGYGILLYTFKK